MAFARIVTRYWRHGSWLEDGILLGTPAHAWPGSLAQDASAGTALL